VLGFSPFENEAELERRLYIYKLLLNYFKLEEE